MRKQENLEADPGRGEGGALGASASAPWREAVLQRMLGVAAVVSPLLVALAVVLRSSPRRWVDVVLPLLAGAVPPALRFGSRAPVAEQAGAVIAVVFATSIYFLARIGFAAGVPVSLAATCVLGGIYLGRSFGLGLVVLATLSVAAIGLLVTRGAIGLYGADVDPFRFLNWLRMAATTTLLAGLLASVVEIVIRQVEAYARSAAQSLADLRLAFAELAQLNVQLEAAKEDERRFIAHELHDELGQLLTALKLRLQLDARGASGLGVPDGSPGLTDALALIDDLLGRVRKMAGDLRPPLLDEVGLAPALRGYLEGQAAGSGVAIDLEIGDASAWGKLGPDLEIACFRVVQESVTNALRHARARRVRVILRRQADRLAISIRDDGRGFDPATLDDATAAGHLGVIGMRERVQGRGGLFTLHAQPGGGCAVEVELPAAAAAGHLGAAPLAAALAERAARWAEIGSWRESARLGTLTVAAVVTPLLSALALFVGSSPRMLIDVVALTAAGVLLRFFPRRSIVIRAGAGILVLFSAAVFVLARAGFGTGVSVLLVACSVIALVCIGRWFGFILILLSAASYLAVGQLVTHGLLVHDLREADPRLLENWLRMAAAIALHGTLLVTVVDFVIRHLEANARAATEAASELGGAYQRLGRLHGRLDAAKEEERRFIAHELHDELGQTLTALKLRLQLGARLEAALAAALANGEALALIDQLIGRVRKMSGDLRPTLLDEVGLLPALRAYVDAQASLSGVAIALGAHEEPEGPRLPPALEIACFRIIQESLTNALRHADPRRIEVRVAREPDRISLSVRDDGKGFDSAPTLEAAALGGHLGVVGMRERVRAHGGTFALSSRVGGGTTIWVTLPIAVGPEVSARAATA
jgi:signal transduction histidine kinase